jgi:methylmalonyl-CoA/ethylmalonyl-CoA epimerase
MKGASMEKKEKSAFDKFDHVGMVVRDMDKAITSLSALGLGPFGTPEGESAFEVSFQGMLRGKPSEWKVKISFFKMGGLNAELLQPSGGKSLLQEFLDTCGEGVHHICYIVEDVDGEAAKLVKKGAKVLTTGRAARGGFAYLETGGGIILELRGM